MRYRGNLKIWLVMPILLLEMVGTADAMERHVPSQYSTIQSAIDATSSGDIILVEPGIYFENLNFRGKAISIQSISGPSLTAIKGNGGKVVIMGGPGAEIVGFTITGGKSDYGAGVAVSGSSSVIRENIFEGNTQTAGGFGAAIGGNCASPIIEKNIFWNNTSDNQWLSGVVSFINSSSPVIRNNIFAHNNSNAIVLTLPSGNKPRVTNNTIINNRIGIRVDSRVNQKEQVFQNNILVANQNGLRIENGWEPYYPTWEYNLVFGNNVDYVGIRDQTGIAGNIHADPCFVNANAGDYHLRPDSPCIDAGDPISDFGLEPEPDGGRIDMGAYGNTPEATSKHGLVLQSYNLISRTRITRTVFDYVYKMTLNNNSNVSVSSVHVELLDAPANISILDNDVTFAYIAPGQSVLSDDTFTLRIDRSIPIDPTIISWRATINWVGGTSTQQIQTTRIPIEIFSGDITGDKIINHNDMVVLADQWLQPPGVPSADIAPEPQGDGFVNFLDLAVLANEWLRH